MNNNSAGDTSIKVVQWKVIWYWNKTLANQLSMDLTLQTLFMNIFTTVSACPVYDGYVFKWENQNYIKHISGPLSFN